MTTELRESIPTGDTSGALIMPGSESPRAGQGGQIQMTAGRPSRGGTVTFEGEYAMITFERSIRHPIRDPRRVGSPHRIRASRPLVHDASPPRCARRGEHRLQKRPGSISRDGEDPRVATAEGLRTRVERRAAEGTPEGGEEHRTLGAHPRRRGYAPSPHAQAADTPDRGRLLVRHPRLPRPARERTRRRTPCGLAHPGRRGPLELPRMGCLRERLPPDNDAGPRGPGGK